MAKGQDRVVEALIRYLTGFLEVAIFSSLPFANTAILGNNQDLSTILSCKKQLTGNLWFHEHNLTQESIEIFQSMSNATHLRTRVPQSSSTMLVI